MADRPLEGIRIVVTRPEAKPLAEELERLGAEVSLVPLIEIRPAEDPGPLNDAAERLAEYHWIVFTSVNAVSAVGARLSGLAGETRVAAVGPVTPAGRNGDYQPGDRRLLSYGERTSEGAYNDPVRACNEGER